MEPRSPAKPYVYILCRKLMDGLKCIDEFTTTCLDEDHRAYFNTLYTGTTHVIMDLCETGYAANGAAGFFEKLLEDDSISLPEFLSTHPSSESRVEDINLFAEELGCSTEPNPDAQWDDFIASLPPLQSTE